MTQSLHKRIRWRLEWYIRRRALAWVLKYQEDDSTPAERAEFEEWFAKDVRHQRAFRAAWYAVVRTEAAMVEMDERRAETSWAPKPQPARRVWMMSAATVAAALVVIIGLRIMGPADILVYTTAIGESRSIALPDGSEVSLNTRSQLVWQPCLLRRCASLTGGEAYFQVAKGNIRPFVVSLGDGATIRVTGTEFNVRRHRGDGDTDVTVITGTVTVSGREHGGIAAWSRELHADEQLSFGPTGVTTEIRLVSGIAAASWRSGMLEIHGPLPAAVCRLAEYLEQPVFVDGTISRYVLHERLDVRDAPKALMTLDPSRIVVERYKGGYLVKERSASVDSEVHVERCP
jgi:transmembrane sensor